MGRSLEPRKQLPERVRLGTAREQRDWADSNAAVQIVGEGDTVVIRIRFVHRDAFDSILSRVTEKFGTIVWGHVWNEPSYDESGFVPGEASIICISKPKV